MFQHLLVVLENIYESAVCTLSIFQYSMLFLSSLRGLQELFGVVPFIIRGLQDKAQFTVKCQMERERERRGGGGVVRGEKRGREGEMEETLQKTGTVEYKVVMLPYSATIKIKVPLE